MIIILLFLIKDDGGRYSYKNQPDICKWNCMKLGEAISGAVPLERTKPLLDLFDEEYSNYMKQKIRKKVIFTKFTKLWICFVKKEQDLL